MKKFSAVVLLICISVCSAVGQQSLDRQYFRQLPLIDGRLSPVFTIAQDNDRFIWIGTDNGLVRYDGYNFEPYRSGNDSTSLCNNRINTLLCDTTARHMLVGTDAGAVVYRPSTDSFSRLTAVGERHVKAFLRTSDSLWIATTSGLLLCDSNLHLLCEYSAVTTYAERHIPSSHVACCRRVAGQTWFGSYNYLYRLCANGSIEALPLPYSNLYRNNLLLDITADSRQKSILWLGTECGLIKYDIAGGTSQLLLRNTPVKNFLHTADGRLLIGTDNGLYVMDDNEHFMRYSHQVENSYSLPNNVVWTIFDDASGNIWLGTDHGLSALASTADFTYRNIKALTGSDDGLDVSVIRNDRTGGVWLGGMNGLMACNPHNNGVWFKSGNGSRSLSHNKVRDLYSDSQGMWIASDGGLDRYDYTTRRIRRFHIVESSGQYSSNWMYAVGKDRNGKLWLGTYDGGLFVVDAASLLRSEAAYTADEHLSAHSTTPISGDVVSQIALTDFGCVAVTNCGADIISLDCRSSRPLRLPDAKPITCVRADRSGAVAWIGTDEGLYRLDASLAVQRVEGFSLGVQSIVPDFGKIWIIGNSYISRYDIAAAEWHHYPCGDHTILCGESSRDGLRLGTVDGYFDFTDNGHNAATEQCRPIFTSLFLNNRRVAVGETYKGNVILPCNISHADKITLRYNQNSFALGFSDLRFTDGNGRFAYRLCGFDQRWQQTSDNRAVFINVPSGDYVAEVCSLAPDGSLGNSHASLAVHIRHVWYATTAAYVIYIVLAAAMIAWALYFVRMRHMLQIEHMEREKTLKLVAMKTDFFANLSHEFKSPLSIILGVIGKMVASESDAIRTRELQAVQSNAEKMHLLIDQMLEYNENGSESLFIPAATSLQELARKVYDSFVPAFEQRNINSRFLSDNIGYIFMIDRLKMESALHNLLSNALKFTPDGGSVLVTVGIGRQTPDILYADIKVEDTGCGIDPTELPYIFNRYYRAPSNQGNNSNGSGIGLYLVKKIVEMHKGSVSVTSERGRGSCFTVRLSTMKADSFILQSAKDEEFTLHTLSKVWQHNRKPIILLVEDNADIRDFITASLGKDYTFLTASEGKAGLDIVAAEKVDLVMTDIAMPDGMDGLTMSRQIRKGLNTTFLPIIVLTGKNDAQTQLQAVEYADAFITKPFNLQYLNSCIIQLLIKHEQYWQKMKQQQMLAPQVETLQSADERFLQEIIDIVNHHIDNPDFSAAALCEESRYGDKNTYRKIKQLTGMSIVEFIRDIRLQRAASYLAQHKLSVTEIMYAVGFTTASYFAKCFKAKYGVAPSEYGSDEESKVV